MDSVQEQLTVVSNKVDALHQVIEQLDHKLTTTLSQQDSHSRPFPGATYSESSLHTDPGMTHKDVLAETTSFDAKEQQGDKPLSPEIQIQRLTAQLTAAYNRIAALEEQLLSQRVH
ncbi:hypothetical protein [Acaryochloris sp. IP29b_bin.137]|uniref:hypothetical protein n=1 Tax=Acaryochloris sp. IP29b_bin.137 TaxID=2969217 RepID=UPI0026162249|nr:hypothetical protein [Acaryochloris sp. IP29b_bin.137]